MKKRTFLMTTPAATLLGLLLLNGFLLQAEEPNLKELAHRIITTSANVKPGDVVVIAGGKHTLPMMEDRAIVTAKAGGLVKMILSYNQHQRGNNRVEGVGRFEFPIVNATVTVDGQPIVREGKLCF